MKTWQISNSTPIMTVMRNFINLEKKDDRQSVKVKSLAWLQSIFSSTKSPSSTKLPKTHDYTQYKSGIDYFFEVAYPADTAIMTGRGMGIKSKDYFLLSVDGRICKYQVEEVDYYSKPSNMWIVSLKYIIE